MYTGNFSLNHPQPVPLEQKPPSTIVNPPKISINDNVPELFLEEGKPLELVVEVQGTPPFEYQWILNGGSLSGGDTASFAIPKAALEDSGEYSLLVKNSAGIDSAVIAQVEVAPSKEISINDDVENADWLLQRQGSVSTLTRNATGQTGEPNHAARSTPLNSVWWKWTAPADGTLRLDTNGSSFDTTLAAYGWKGDLFNSRDRRSGNMFSTKEENDSRKPNALSPAVLPNGLV